MLIDFEVRRRDVDDGPAPALARPRLLGARRRHGRRRRPLRPGLPAPVRVPARSPTCFALDAGQGRAAGRRDRRALPGAARRSSTRRCRRSSRRRRERPTATGRRHRLRSTGCRRTGSGPATRWSRRSCASATPERDDRLFPGDIEQFEHRRASTWPTARPACCTRWTRPGPAAIPSTRSGWSSGRRTRSPVPGSGSTTACTAWPTCWTGWATGHEAQKVLDICHRRAAATGTRSASTCTAAWPASASTCSTSADAPASPRCAKWRGGSPTAVADRLGDEDSVGPDQRRASIPMPGCCAARPGPPCCSSACTSRPATRRCSTWPPPPCARTSAAASRATTARCEVDEGWRTMPYLADGSVGVGMVLDRVPAPPPRRALRRRPRTGSAVPPTAASTSSPACSPAEPA